MAYTLHGSWILGSSKAPDHEERMERRKRCGGISYCPQCKKESKEFFAFKIYDEYAAREVKGSFELRELSLDPYPNVFEQAYEAARKLKDNEMVGNRKIPIVLFDRDGNEKPVGEVGIVVSGVEIPGYSTFWDDVVIETIYSNNILKGFSLSIPPAAPAEETRSNMEQQMTTLDAMKLSSLQKRQLEREQTGLRDFDGDQQRSLEKQMGRSLQARVVKIVRSYVESHEFDVNDGPIPDFDVYVVWFCKTLQHWKAMVSTSLLNGMYYEVTHNGDKSETYVDAYKKFNNVVIFD